jgi:hypothetical protein
MKGYYCIYECSKNQWLLDDVGHWVSDRDYYTQMVGKKHAIQISQNYNYNPNGTQIEIIDTESIAVLTDNGVKVNAENLKKFETMMEAETYLLNAFSSDAGNFYSIRKIYF